MISLSDAELAPVVISWPTQCFRDFEYFCRDSGHTIQRMDPEVFLSQGVDTSHQYLNLITRDMSIRKAVSLRLGTHARFSFVHPKSEVDPGCVSPGCMIYPFVYAVNCELAPDVLCFGHNGLAHGCSVGTGTILGTFAYVSGTSQVGDFCHLHTRVTVYDKVTMGSDVTVAAGSYVRKSITQPGTYTSTSTGTLRRIPTAKGHDLG